MKDNIEVVVADESHEKYVDTILETISEAAKVCGSRVCRQRRLYFMWNLQQGLPL